MNNAFLMNLNDCFSRDTYKFAKMCLVSSTNESKVRGSWVTFACHFLNKSAPIGQLCLFLLIAIRYMKSKKITLTLALMGGSAGADRFYMGQQNAGWLILLMFWLVVPGAIYGVIRFNLAPNWEPFILAKYALPILYHFVAMGRYLVMSEEKFVSQDASKGKLSPMTFGAFAIALILAIGASRMISQVQAPDIDTVQSAGAISSVSLSQEFRADEEAYRKRYDNKPFQVSGTVTETGMDFESGAYFALQGTEGDPFGIKCIFGADHQKDPESVVKGDVVEVKGFINGNKLENCTILTINGKPHSTPGQ